jgi:hypothetical protein
MNEWKEYLYNEFKIELDLEQNKAFVLLPVGISELNTIIALTAKIKELVDNYFVDYENKELLIVDEISFKIEKKFLEDSDFFYKKCRCCDTEFFTNFSQVIYSNYGGKVNEIHLCSEKCKSEHFKVLSNFTNRVSLEPNFTFSDYIK